MCWILINISPTNIIRKLFLPREILLKRSGDLGMNRLKMPVMLLRND